MSAEFLAEGVLVEESLAEFALACCVEVTVLRWFFESVGEQALNAMIVVTRDTRLKLVDFMCDPILIG